MKNYEKYAEEIKNYNGKNFCNNFVIPVIRKGCECLSSCEQCRMLQNIWLLEEYEEPETDWSKVEVDTPILVRQGKNGRWLERHFAKYENGNVYAWEDGQTSWTEADEIKWKYAKLVEDQKEPEINWNKVEVDTPILVRATKNEEWSKRYFAKYENGYVHAWIGGCTSWSEENASAWRYAKLAESEEE